MSTNTLFALREMQFPLSEIWLNGKYVYLNRNYFTLTILLVEFTVFPVDGSGLFKIKIILTTVESHVEFAYAGI